ncbi:MAG TPA: alpha/beta hydrolase [Methylococcaceae bacterium]|nr:alpha/beta hydrolase [Methylococcaceae bacterium]
MAELLAGHGFHVVVLPSPFSWNFALAASAAGFPGLVREDSKDLYAAMQRVLGDIKAHYQAKIRGIGMLGLSQGALYAAHISQIDSLQRSIGLDTYLLVNPPVDVLATIGKIDEMADLGRDFKAGQKRNLEDYAFGTAAKAMRQDTEAPGYFADWDKRLQLTPKQMKYLIGKAFRSAVGDTLYVIEQAYRPGLLKTPVSWGYRSGRLEEAREHPVMRYVTTGLIPRLRQFGDSSMSVEALNENSSLKYVGTALAGNSKVFLMHNRDDFLVSAEDLEYLEGIFRERAKIYPRGGHLGNLWYSVNRQDIVGVFRHMQGSR